MTAPEFSHPVALDTIGETARMIAVEADEAERMALARRFQLASITRLQANVAISRKNGAPFAEGRVEADLVQSCVVTGDPLPVHVEEPFAIRFLPEESVVADSDEIELQTDEVDTVFYEGGAIDIGEVVAETMALALDPFPRGPRADEALREAGVIGEGEAGPFSALKALKDRMKSEG